MAAFCWKIKGCAREVSREPVVVISALATT
jgi:hypothetical protein